VSLLGPLAFLDDVLLDDVLDGTNVFFLDQAERPGFDEICNNLAGLRKELFSLAFYFGRNVPPLVVDDTGPKRMASDPRVGKALTLKLNVFNSHSHRCCPIVLFDN